MTNQPPQESSLEESIINAQITEQTDKTETTPLFFGMALVLISTLLTTYVVGGNWGWWGKMRQAMREAATVIEKIPKSFCDWEAAADDEPLSQVAIEQLELADYVVRRYTNRTTGETVSLILMIGPTGRLTAHTPQICFGGRNFLLDSPPIPVSFPYEGDEENTSEHSGNKDVLAKVVFKNQSVSGGAKLFYYGVSTGKEWMPITNSSRTDLQRCRFLYKLQLEAFISEENSGDNDLIARFLRTFLPQIRSELVECF